MPVIYSIGHSTRSITEFISLLKHHHVAQLVDIRSFPMSRYVPQFNQDVFKRALNDADIEYVWIEALGGRRHGPNTGLNTGWKNQSFRSYADYMQTDAYLEGLARLFDVAKILPSAIMCSEAVPFRCHRNLVSDSLVVRGWTVYEITGMSQPKPHQLIPFAKVNGMNITYPA